METSSTLRSNRPMKRNGLLLTLLAFQLLLVNCSSKTGASHPVEVGPTTWLRDYAQAAERAEKEEKPIFALFQEVPG